MRAPVAEYDMEVSLPLLESMESLEFPFHRHSLIRLSLNAIKSPDYSVVVV
jgi:hypothetical protein